MQLLGYAVLVFLTGILKKISANNSVFDYVGWASDVSSQLIDLSE